MLNFRMDCNIHHQRTRRGPIVRLHFYWLFHRYVVPLIVYQTYKSKDLFRPDVRPCWASLGEQNGQRCAMIHASTTYLILFRWASGASSSSMLSSRLGTSLLSSLHLQLIRQPHTKVRTRYLVRAFASRRRSGSCIGRHASRADVSSCNESRWTRPTAMAAHRFDWMDCGVRPSWQCGSPVHDWRILVKVWD
jgi:hypothetical protein